MGKVKIMTDQEKYKAAVLSCIKKNQVLSSTPTDLPLQTHRRSKVKEKALDKTKEIPAEEMKEIFHELCPQ